MKRMFLAANALLSILLTTFAFASTKIENGACPELLVPAKSLTVTPGVLTVGMQVGFDPVAGFSFVDPSTGKPIGFDVSVACLFAQCLGLTVTIKNLALTDLTGALLSGGIDIILSQQSRTPSLLRAYEQVPYGGTGDITLVLKRSSAGGLDSGTDLLSALNARGGTTKLAVVAGSVDENILATEIANGLTHLSLVPVPDVNTGLQAISNGTVFGLLSQGLTVEENDPTFTQLVTTVAPALQPGPISAGIVKSNCDLINAFANFVRLNEKQIANLAAQFTPSFPFNASDLAFTPQVCQLVQEDPCAVKCPFIEALRNKLCPITGACPQQVINLNVA